ncbi:hypothetical protein [Paraflavitalea speifideaquila]|uniref:hypothetical protein n=1 Tax=Paraflavitalea speifideaquila TaxID=3076558 RepID=UPI0028EE9C7F|nr:hypothetical protein [Paraflavitalea speifideiaquila]
MSSTIVIPQMKEKVFTRGTQYLIALWQRSFTDPLYRLLLHVAFWVFLLFYWLRENMIVHIEVAQDYAITLTGVALGLFLFYALVYGIIPLIIKRRWLLAIISCALYYLVAVLLRTYHISQLVEQYKGANGWFAGQDFWDNFYSHQLQPHQLFTYFFNSITGLITIIYIPLRSNLYAMLIIRTCCKASWKKKTYNWNSIS